MKRSVARATVLTAMCVALAACSTPPEDPEAENTETFAQMVEHDMAAARKHGASERQIALLVAAQAAGEMSFEATREAARNDVECMNAAGVDAEYGEQYVSGVLLPGYVAHVGVQDDGANQAKVEACDALEFGWVSSLFQTQPATMAVKAAHNEKFAPAMRQCLEEAGFGPDADATWDDLVHLAAQEAGTNAEARECLSLVGEAAVAR